MEQTQTVKTEQTKKAKNTVGFLLTVVMMGLTIFVLYIQNENYQTIETSSDLSLNSNARQSDNYRHYVKKYNDTKAQLAETQTRLSKMTLELELVNKELESTKSVLSDTQNMLAQAQEQNKVLSGDPAAAARLQKITSSGQVASQTVSKNLQELQKKNENYTGELAKLQNDMNNYQANVKDLDAGKAIIREFKAKINEVKQKMNGLKREARLAKITAQDEHDRQMAILGNNGYMFKDGESKSVAQAQEKSVDIDVKFVP